MFARLVPSTLSFLAAPVFSSSGTFLYWRMKDQKPQFLSFPFAALPPNDFYDPGTISPRCFRASLSVAAVGGGGIGVHEGVFLFESVYLDTI